MFITCSGDDSCLRIVCEGTGSDIGHDAIYRIEIEIRVQTASGDTRFDDSMSTEQQLHS
jgi:hypothetical protein